MTIGALRTWPVAAGFNVIPQNPDSVFTLVAGDFTELSENNGFLFFGAFSVARTNSFKVNSLHLGGHAGILQVVDFCGKKPLTRKCLNVIHRDTFDLKTGPR